MPFTMSGNNDGWSYNRFDEFEEKLEEMKHRDAKTGEVVDKAEVGKTYYPEGERQKSSVALRKEKEAAKKKSDRPNLADVYGADRRNSKPLKMKEEAELEEGKSERPLGVMHQFARGVKQERGAKKDEGGKYLRQQHTKKQNEKEEKKEAEKSAAAERNATPSGGTWYKEHLEAELEEGIDFKGAKRIDDARAKAQAEKDKKNPSGKDYRLALRKFRPGASNEERAEGHRDNMREKGTSPIKNGKKMFEDLKASGLFSDAEIEALVEASCGAKGYQEGGEVKHDKEDCKKCKGKGCDHCGDKKKSDKKDDNKKPDYIDADKDGDKEEPMEKALKEKDVKEEYSEVNESRKEGESPKDYAKRMTAKYKGGKSKTYDPMKDPSFDHDKAERTRGSMKEDIDPMVEAAVAALAPLLKGAGAAKAAGAAAKGSGLGAKIGSAAKGMAKDAAMDLGASAVDSIKSIPGKIASGIGNAARETQNTESDA